MVESSWNVTARYDAREGKWRGNWRMEWVASTLHTTSEHGVSCITTADAHNSAPSSRLNWRPCRFKWTRPFRRNTKSGFCACAITFQTQSDKWCKTYAGNKIENCQGSSFRFSFPLNNEFRQRRNLWPPDSKNVNFNKSLIHAFSWEEVRRSHKSLKGPIEQKRFRTPALQ